MQTRHDFSQKNLTLFERNEDEYFARLVTMDESWVYLYDPETKEMSKECKTSIPIPTEDVIFEVEQWFSSKAEDFYKEDLKQVKKRWQKCVTLQGDYMEKN